MGSVSESESPRQGPYQEPQNKSCLAWKMGYWT
uniref:Uncharacterized protein n=1 Tax=Rhizophora mucronata TaxID=61149 RepID=A0A2P2NDU2_RHIMU